jgi:RNA polymerase sigma-70 factor, ECF subfamily
MSVTLVNAARKVPQHSDAAAIARSLESPGAFAGVFERHHAAIHRYLARRLGADLADELAAETFAVAFAKRGRYDLAVPDARPCARRVPAGCRAPPPASWPPRLSP